LTQACPGLVEQVEAGDLDGPATRDLLRRYVQPLLARGADTLVLGCTHYPFLRDALVQLVGPRVVVIDTGAAVARQVARVIDVQAVPRVGDVRFYTSDMRVAPVMHQLWGESIHVAPLPVSSDL
jgi:glutamate racemase